MKRFSLIFLLGLLFMFACKKDSVDASSTKNFQSSINDMASSLDTWHQVKFNEALYILKTFGVEGKNDLEKINNLGKLLNGKKVPEIMAMADSVAQKNGVTWSSSEAPSLGEMNIFSDEKASQVDNNDVKASSLSIIAKPISADSILGPKAIQIIPRLVDESGNPITFSGAALETIMEVSNNGAKLVTSKNLMQDNNFKGFTLRFASLPKEKIADNLIDVKVIVKTSKKNYQMIKAGIPVNEKALLSPQINTGENATNSENQEVPSNPEGETDAAKPAKPASNPSGTVSKFLNNLGSKNLHAAYDVSENPNWGSFEAFSNPTSGFGAVKSLSVKNVSTNSSSDKAATVNATYEVTDNNGKTTSLKVTFGLKNSNGEWKISSYKIN